jgi:hypothetical protein
LYLGFSLLSFVEFIDVGFKICQVLITFCLNKNKKNKIDEISENKSTEAPVSSFESKEEENKVNNKAIKTYPILPEISSNKD